MMLLTVLVSVLVTVLLRLRLLVLVSVFVTVLLRLRLSVHISLGDLREKKAFHTPSASSSMPLQCLLSVYVYHCNQ